VVLEVLSVVKQAGDGTLYVLVATGQRSFGGDGDGPEPVYVARIGADGQQRGAFSVRLERAQHLALAVGDDGRVHLGGHFDGQAALDSTLTGNGIVGGSLRFDP
jgi:hypothetical protein